MTIQDLTLEKDLILSSSHDLQIKDFDIALTTDAAIVAQRVKQALLLFRGEWFLDTELGMPYYESILGSKNSIDAVRAIFISEIRSVEGVKDLVEFDIQFNEETRLVKITFTIEDVLGNTTTINI